MFNNTNISSTVVDQIIINISVIMLVPMLSKSNNIEVYYIFGI